MGLADWFSVFCHNLCVQDGGTIATRYKAITRRLNTDFWTTNSDTAHSLYVGSYGRNTAIAGFSDLDMVFELPATEYARYNAYNGNKQSALLQTVKRSIETTYRTTGIKADGQVVLAPFKDGITFEVLPVFVNQAKTYTYPDTNSGGVWRTTNPRAEIVAFRTRNAACNGNLVWLCRMMRAWRNHWDVPIGGLLIDTLAYQFIETYEHRAKSFLYYDYLCRDFFHWMANQSSSQEYWRAPGSGAFVYGKGLFQYKATRCYNISCEATAHEAATPKREWSAKQKWREVFGTTFPN